MKVPLLDLQAQYQSVKKEMLEKVQEVMESQRFILGPEVEQCEKSIAAYCGVNFACGVSSGTDALVIALMNEGIGPEDEVITPDYTFFATCGSVVRVGAIPVFADIDPATYNIDITQIESLITSRTKAIIPVHLFGQMADMTPLMKIAEKHGLVVIEDAAQAIGTEYEGKRAGSFGRYGCFSFFPSKNLGCFGDGGMVVTQDPDVIKQLQVLRNHGADPKYYYKRIGGNFRLDALQAAVVNVKLKHLDRWSEARQKNAKRYEKLFSEAGIDAMLQLPKVIHGRHVFNQYVIRIEDRRDELMNFLLRNEIGCEIYYPRPMHLQECFADMGHRQGEFPESEKACRETLALPIFPEMKEDQQDFVVERIAGFLKGR